MADARTITIQRTLDARPKDVFALVTEDRLAVTRGRFAAAANA